MKGKSFCWCLSGKRYKDCHYPSYSKPSIIAIVDKRGEATDENMIESKALLLNGIVESTKDKAIVSDLLIDNTTLLNLKIK